MQDAEVATAQLLAITAESGAELPSLTVFAMGSVAERYRVEAADLLAIMPSASGCSPAKSGSRSST